MVFCRKSPGTKQPNRSTCRTRDETNRCPAVRLAESQNQIESLLMGLKRCENKWENSKWVRFILFGKQFMEAFFSCRIHPHACLDPYQSRLTNKTNSLNCIPFRRQPATLPPLPPNLRHTCKRTRFKDDVDLWIVCIAMMPGNTLVISG